MPMRSLFCKIALLLVVSEPAAAAPLPVDARAMSPSDVRQVYSGATWNWKELSTGIYFAPSGSLIALEHGRHTRSGAGRWVVDGAGRLCVSIHWQRVSKAASSSRSCWNHRRVGQAIWKQNDRRAKWYSLHGPSNEAGRIVSGNRLQGMARRESGPEAIVAKLR